MLRFYTICDQPTRLRALTGLPVHQFLLLAHMFDKMFLQCMCNETLDGYQREGRSYSTYANCPLPTPEDKMLFLLTYLKQNTIQEVHGQLFGMTQSNVSKWYRILSGVLRKMLQSQHLVPARTCEELTKLLRQVHHPSNSSVELLEGGGDAAISDAPAPFFIMMAQNVQ